MVEIAFHVQHREAVLLDLLGITGTDHPLEHLRLAGGALIVVGQQGSHRRGTTAEVILLRHHPLPADLLKAAGRHLEGAEVAGNGDLAGSGRLCRGKGSADEQQRGGEPTYPVAATAYQESP